MGAAGQGEVREAGTREVLAGTGQTGLPGVGPLSRGGVGMLVGIICFCQGIERLGNCT